MMRFAAVSLFVVFSGVAGFAQAFEDDWRAAGLETPIGVDGGRMQEDAMPFLRDSHGRRVEVRDAYGSTLSSAIGNLINVQAERGSTVIINAMQINRGNQRAVTTINDKSAEAIFENVEPAAGPAN